MHGDKGSANANVDIEAIIATLQREDPAGLYCAIHRIEDRPAGDEYPLVPDIILGVVRFSALFLRTGAVIVGCTDAVTCPAVC